MPRCAGSGTPGGRRTELGSPTVRMPVMRWRVVCALAEVMLTFCPTSAFNRVDLPTWADRRSHEPATLRLRARLRRGGLRCRCSSGLSNALATAPLQDCSGPPGLSLCFRASSIRRAASCSAPGATARSPLPPGSGQHRALDLEGLGMGLAAGGTDPVGGHRQATRLEPLLEFGLGVFDQLATSVVEMISPKRPVTTVRAASKPPSRNVAPMSASRASARMEARWAPPPRASPSPR